MTLHIESLDPEVYAKLMSPLRLPRVLPKIQQIIEDFPTIRINIPVSRLNVDEIPTMKRYFSELGAPDVFPTFLGNRCARDRSTFEQLAIAPYKWWCNKDILNELVVDCTGEVLICCEDFEHREPVGDLSKITVRELLDSPRRAHLAALWDAGEIGSLDTCAHCYVSSDLPA